MRRYKYLLFLLLVLVTATSIAYSGFTLPTTVALLILVSAVSTDFLTTWLCLRKKGKEGNPIVAFLFRKVGLHWSFLAIAGLWVCFILFRWLGQTETIQTAVALAYWLVPISNLQVLAKLSRKVRVIG